MRTLHEQEWQIRDRSWNAWIRRTDFLAPMQDVRLIRPSTGMTLAYAGMERLYVVVLVTA